MDSEDLCIFQKFGPNSKPIYDSSDDISDPDEDDDYETSQNIQPNHETFTYSKTILNNNNLFEFKAYDDELKPEDTMVKTDSNEDKTPESFGSQMSNRKRKSSQTKRNKLSTLEIAHYMFLRKIIDESVDRKLTYSQQPKELLNSVEEACYRQFPQYDVEFHRDKIKSYLKSCRRNFNRNNGEIVIKDKYQSCESAKKMMMQAYSLEKGIISILPEISQKHSLKMKDKKPISKSRSSGPSKRKKSKFQNQEIQRLSAKYEKRESLDGQPIEICPNPKKLETKELEVKEDGEELADLSSNETSSFGRENIRTTKKLFLSKKRKLLQARQKKYPVGEVAHYMFIRKISDEFLDRKLTYSQQPKELIGAIEAACLRQFPQFDMDVHRDKIKSYLKSCRRNFTRNKGSILVKDKYQACEASKKIMTQAYGVERDVILSIVESQKEVSKNIHQNSKRKEKGSKHYSRKNFWQIFTSKDYGGLMGNEECVAKQMVDEIWSQEDGRIIMDSILQSMLKNVY